jgi:seryl-tRNA synthetase
MTMITKKQLMNMIEEEIIKEFQIQKSIIEKIDEFGELSNEMDKVKKQLDEMKKKYEGLEDELRPLLEELNKYNQRSIQTEKYLLSIKRFGYEKENVKYKEVFEQSLTKVNKNTKKLLEDLLQSTKTISQVVTSIGVQKIGEGFFTDFVNKIKTLLNKLTNSVKRSLTDMDDLILISKKLFPKETIE